MELFDGSRRERFLLIGMGLALGVVLILFVLFRGDGGDMAGPQDDLDVALQNFLIVETGLANRSVAGADEQVNKTPFNRGSVLRVASAAELRISRVEPGPQGALSVNFDPAPSESVLFFMSEIERTTTARIVTLDMEAADQGQVEANLTLRAP